MGLLRSRPKIDKSDTAFQAFARLSLANDSDMLLERLMCMVPQNPSQHWSSVADAYKVNVWDIYPTCQIAGVCDKDTILVDGAFGATIHWDKFRKVANTRRVKSWKRLAVQTILHGAPFIFPTGVAMYELASGFSKVLGEIKNISGIGAIGSIGVWATFFKVIACIFIAISSLVFIFSPYLTRLLYRGKFCRCSPLLAYIHVELTIFKGVHRPGCSVSRAMPTSKQSKLRYSDPRCVDFAGAPTDQHSRGTVRIHSMNPSVLIQFSTQKFATRLKQPSSILAPMPCAFLHWWIRTL